MKVLIEMPLDEFNRLLERCERTSREFHTLISGCIETRQNGEHVARTAEFLCDQDEAKLLLELANRTSPDAAAQILKSLDLFREK